MNVLYTCSSTPRRRMTDLPACAAQRGASLLVAIVALAIMTIAGLSLMRSVDTGNVIAGNMAFRGATVNAADGGVEAAATYLNATIAPAPDLNLPNGCAVGTQAPLTLGNCLYSARIQPEDDSGVPLIDWNSANIPATVANGYSYQFVVERLCNPDAAVPVVLGQAAKAGTASVLCGSTLVPPNNSRQGGRSQGVSGVVAVMYRVTVRVVGPRNTISIIQTILER